MPEAIVDEFETIEVDENDRGTSMIVGRDVLQRECEPIHKERPIAQPREVVMVEAIRQGVLLRFDRFEKAEPRFARLFLGDQVGKLTEK